MQNEAFVSAAPCAALASHIRDGSYKPDNRSKHKQTPVELGEFRFPIAVKHVAEKYGVESAIHMALGCACAPGLTALDAERWLRRL